MKRNVLFLSLLLTLSPLHSSCQKEANLLELREENTVDKETVLRIINAYRAAGCNCGKAGTFAPATPVKWNDTLELAAIVHSSDMYAKKFFSHKGSDGSRMGDRIKRLGYNWTMCGENIGRGYLTEDQVINGWMNSAGHCRNIMNPNFNEIGVARVGDCWTMVLGAR
jgi:uncharacterized protein YkwD